MEIFKMHTMRILILSLPLLLSRQLIGCTCEDCCRRVCVCGLSISMQCIYTYFMTYFYAPIFTIVSGVLQPPIISLQRSVTIITRATL